MVEVTGELTDLEYQVMRLYNEGVVVRLILKETGLTLHTLRKTLTHLADEGLIEKRSPGRRPQEKPEVKNYSWNSLQGCFHVKKNGVYYGRVKTEAQAEYFVKLLKQFNWDKNKASELRIRAIKECKEEEVF